MSLSPASALLFFYGMFLMGSGIAAVAFIGPKAKTALASGGISGILAMVAGHFVSTGSENAKALGIFLAFALFCVFAWRATKTLYTIFDLMRSGDRELKGKGIAFLIISLMAVVSIIVTLQQSVYYMID